MRRSATAIIAVLLSGIFSLVADSRPVDVHARTATHRCHARHVEGILITRLKTNAKCAAVTAVARKVVRQIQPCIGCYVRARHRVWDCAGEWTTGTARADYTARLAVSCATAPGGKRWVRFSFRRYRGSAD